MADLTVQRGLCCGWRELGSMSNYRGDFNGALRSLCYNNVVDGHRANCGALLFTAAGSRSKYGDKFMADIEKRKLGTVTKLTPFKNPNTGRVIQSYLWILDQQKLKAYCNKNNLLRAEGWW